MLYGNHYQQWFDSHQLSLSDINIILSQSVNIIFNIDHISIYIDVENNELFSFLSFGLWPLATKIFGLKSNGTWHEGPNIEKQIDGHTSLSSLMGMWTESSVQLCLCFSWHLKGKKKNFRVTITTFIPKPTHLENAFLFVLKINCNLRRPELIFSLVFRNDGWLCILNWPMSQMSFCVECIDVIRQYAALLSVAWANRASGRLDQWWYAV